MAPDPIVTNDLVMPDNFLGALVTGADGTWDDQNATVALAVALAESGGKPGAVGHNTNGSSDWGLWQINDKAHPEMFSEGDTRWADPVSNRDMAFKVWQQAGGKWTPWSTYTNGRYQMYMNRAATAILNRDFNGAQAWMKTYDEKVYTAHGLASISSLYENGISGLGDNPLLQIVKIIGKIFDPKTWISVSLMFAGALMLLLVGWQVMKGGAAVKKVTGTVKKGIKLGTKVGGVLA